MWGFAGPGDERPQRVQGGRGAAARLLLLLLVGVLALIGARTGPAQASGPIGARTGPAQASDPIGAHSMLQLNDPYSFMQTMFAEAAGMHASLIRLDVAPALIFPDQSEAPDFSGLDEVMALAQQYHLRVLADLFTIPPWMASCTASSSLAASRCAPDDATAYGSLITQIVSHADPVIRDWEIWNEPDTSEFFSGTPQQYAMMLRTAHDAIKAVDPEANVLLGGISGTGGMAWLSQVFATPGADAIHAFDIANVHERSWLDGLAGDIFSWRWFFGSHGFSGPLWVTEHGYPSDPAFQYDPHYTGGLLSQGTYLTASIPTLIDAGASEVFVTERDNLTGQFASEGLLGGDVSDPPVADPQVVERPAYAAVAKLAACYQELGHDCPGSGPAVSPSALPIAPIRLGASGVGTATVSDPGPGPLMLGTPTLTGAAGMSIANDNCPAVLEPDETCTVSVEFAPPAAGAALGVLQIPSDGGTASVSISAVATSVSSLSSPQLPAPTFTAGSGGDGPGLPQQLVLSLINPLPATVRAGIASLTGPDAARFKLAANTCRGMQIAPQKGCKITVLFTPIRWGTATALLTLTGDGVPLTVTLKGLAIPPPAIKLLASAEPGEVCPVGRAERFVVVTSQPSSVSWSAVRSTRTLNPRCSRVAAAQVPSGHRVALQGRAATGLRLRVRNGEQGYVATVRLRSGLRPGVYRLTTRAVNAHGLGAARAMWITVAG